MPLDLEAILRDMERFYELGRESRASGWADATKEAAVQDQAAILLCRIPALIAELATARARAALEGRP